MAAGFAELPGRIAALTREHERVAVVLLDGFGGRTPEASQTWIGMMQA
jgi:hypothetical protein